MTDSNENRRTVEDIIAAAIDRHDSQDAPRTITPDQLKAMAADRQQQKRRRILRRAAFAAVFVIAVISTALIFSTFTADVGADKNGKDEIRTENGVVIEDGGWGSSSEDKVVITEWEEIDVIKLTNEKLIELCYIPDNYEFKSLTIQKNEIEDTTYEYIFVDSKNNLNFEIEEYVPQKGTMYFDVEDVSHMITCSKGDVYIFNDGKKIATIQIDDGILISIWGNLSDEEIINIIQGLSI